MARIIRERVELLVKGLIKKEDILQIRLQEKMRTAIREKIDGQKARKQFLIALSKDEEIGQLLIQDKIAEAESEALKKLKNLKKG